MEKTNEYRRDTMIHCSFLFFQRNQATLEISALFQVDAGRRKTVEETNNITDNNSVVKVMEIYCIDYYHNKESLIHCASPTEPLTKCQMTQ